MKIIRRQISANARKKNLKIQHHKVNARRQFYFNQLTNELNQESKLQSSQN